jgi:hypothetical protein
MLQSTGIAAARAEWSLPPHFRAAACIIAVPSDGDRRKHTIAATCRRQMCPSPARMLARHKAGVPVAREGRVDDVVPRAQ